MTATPIRSFGHLRAARLDAPVVTLFSGGLDSTYLLLRLRELGVRDVHAMSVDIGEDESFEHKKEVADALGVRLTVFDRRTEFARDYVDPALRAHAVYLGVHPISSSLSRPLIAETAVAYARELGARTILHTANRSQNTLRRLNGALDLLGFAGQFGSPYDLEPVSRADKIMLLKQAGIDYLSDRMISGDSNLWCREFESGSLDNPEEHSITESLFRWSRFHSDEAPREVTLRFEAGRLTAIDSVPVPFLAAIDQLNWIVGRYGLGRYSGLEHLDGGQKVFEVREMPAAWLLLQSIKHLETACISAEAVREKMHIEQLWVRETLEGRWFGQLRLALQAFVDTYSSRINGSVRWRLAPGRATTAAIRADQPLYIRDREAWESASIAAETHALTPIAG